MANLQELSSQIGGCFTVAEVKSLPEGSVFTINFADKKMVGAGAKADEVPCLGFVETKKYLTVNQTRMRLLREMFGANADPLGKKISLAVVEDRGREVIIVTAPHS